MADVSAVLRRMRLQAGLTQRKLAELAGVSERALRDAERGPLGRPQTAVLQRIAAVLGTNAAFSAGAGAGAGAAALEVAVLGPLEVRLGGRTIALARSTQVVLGLLALHPSRVVSLEELADVLWPAGPPASWRNALHVQVNRLRTELEPDRRAGHASRMVPSSRSGYRLALDEASSDLARFDRLAARAEGSPHAGALLRDALDLWRGPVLAGGDDRLLAHPTVHALERKRVAVALSYADAAPEDSEHLIAVLSELAAYEPLHEQLHAKLIEALAGGGRTAAALDLYQQMRRRLVDDLGLEPGPELQAAHSLVLGRTAGAQRDENARRFLPLDVADFTGRTRELRWLDDCARSAVTGGTVVISAIAGLGGIGKTALAVRWATLAADRYPDGQLYLNLRGYDAAAPKSAADALAALLRMVGVPAEAIPSEVDEAAALYRSTVAGLRMIIVLDNARSAEQVRPLLPTGDGTFVVVTSRDRLIGLAAREGAQRLPLPVMSGSEATALLRLLLGAERVGAEPEAAQELLAATGHLPLAIRVAAANLQKRPQQTLESYVAELSADRLETLSVNGDPASSVRTIFDHSVRQLSGRLQEVFGVLGAAPGTDLSAGAAAAACAEDEPAMRRLLAALCDASLLAEDGGRYAMHDLVREHARATAPDDRVLRASRRRLVAYYLRYADAAARIAYPSLLRLPNDREPAASFPSQAEAMAWFDAELPNLVATVRNAADDGAKAVAVALADAMRGYLSIRRHYPQWLSVARTALECAADSPSGQVMARLSLSQAQWWMGRHAEAIETLEPAVPLTEELAWHDATAAMLGNLGAMYGDWGKALPAMEYLRRAHEINVRYAASPGRTANNLTNLGALCNDVGRLVDACIHHTRAKQLYASIGADAAAAIAGANLGAGWTNRGEPAIAIEHLTAALPVLEQAGESYAVSSTRTELAVAHLDLGRRDIAADHVKVGLEVAREIGADDRIAHALSITGLLDRDPASHQQALQHAGGTTHLQCLVQIAYARTLLDLARHDDAAAMAYAAVELARRQAYKYLEGAALTVLAEIHVTEDVRKAREYATQAQAVNEVIGARGLVRRAVAIIERLGPD